MTFVLISQFHYQAIGKAYLNNLLEGGYYDEAGHLCVKILGKRKDSWEEEIYKFAKIQQLKVRRSNFLFKDIGVTMLLRFLLIWSVILDYYQCKEN